MKFKEIREAVGAQFQSMATSQLFVTGIGKDELWDTYLNSFPAGSNPLFKTKTEHDCQCCRSFIRTLGGVVTIKDGQVVTIWDTAAPIAFAYEAVCKTMAEKVRQATIQNIFLHNEKVVGTSSSRKLLSDQVVTWEHFFVNLPASAVCKGDQIGPKLNDARTAHDVMLRGLETISVDVVDTVLELIAQNSLYRGEEHTFVLDSFRKLKVVFDSLSDPASRELFVWSHLTEPPSVSRIRNTSIGTLLVDLSEGADLETAVKSFEAKVAPANYKRPTALVTKAMIQKAQQTIEELGLTTALERRYARLEDITINNVLFADRSAKKIMNVFDDLAAKVPEQNLAKTEEINIEDFIAKVLPKVDSIEALVENRHAGNFVSLIAPCDPTALRLFKWPNNFSWSYAGEMTDSIKDRVKKAGGSVTGDLCCRLAWDYADDLDFHMYEPEGGHIYYPNRRTLSKNGGMLDLDANGADGPKENPVENIFYADADKMRHGWYVLQVHNYARRTDKAGFEVEIEFGGNIHSFAYDKVLREKESATVAMIKRGPSGFEIGESLPSTQASKQVWGTTTQTFHKVNVVMMSPNHWDDKAIGNRHFFFMLEGCTHEGPTRGFYNEFLFESLSPHRKVLEIVGAKMRTDESGRQLSGLGFSSTQRNSITCRVKGSFTRTLKVTF